jgi:hypothetical protein
MSGRVLFLGVTSRREIVGFVASPTSQASAEFRARFSQPSIGVFFELPLPTIFDAAEARRKLVSELRRINELGWIDSKQLARTAHCFRAPLRNAVA